MESDKVCRIYAKKKVKLTVRMLTDQDILIEGNSEALEFLGNLLLAHVKDGGDGRHLGPRSAGNSFFTPESTVGIYIHRLPCDLSHVQTGPEESLGEISKTIKLMN